MASLGQPAGGAGFVRLELYVNNTKVSEINGPSGVFTWTPTAIGNYALTVRGVDATGASATSAPHSAQAAFANWNWRNPDLPRNLRKVTETR